MVVDGDTAIIDPVTTRSSSGADSFNQDEKGAGWRVAMRVIAGTGQGDVLAENARSLRGAS